VRIDVSLVVGLRVLDDLVECHGSIVLLDPFQTSTMASPFGVDC
jgi:hypothetical protein